MKLLNGCTLTILVLSILVISLFIPTSFGQIKSRVDQQELKSSQTIGIDQELVGSQSLSADLIPFLMYQKNETNGWNLTSYSSEGEIYYGLKGGIAGIGMELLSISSSQSTLFSNDVQDQALVLATEIADFLISKAVTDGPQTLWNISESSSITDLGYDFGIAGISVFFAKLANITGNTIYEDKALEGLTAIDNLANYTNGLHWNSSMYDQLDTTSWYPNREMKYFVSETYNEVSTYFAGKSLGSLGVGQAALDIAGYLNINDYSQLPYKIINASHQWLENVKNDNSGEFSFSLSEPEFGLVSTSKALGISGALDFYLDLYSITLNETYLSEADGYFNYLNGTATSQTRYRHSLVVNGSLFSSTIHLGLSHGLAGILESLDNYANIKGNLDFGDELTSFLFFLHNFKIDDGDYIRYPESMSGASPINPGSLSRDNGAGGILPLIGNLSTKYNLTSLETDISKAKAYVYTRTTTLAGLTVLKNLQTDLPENNAAVGYISNYKLFEIESVGELTVSSTSINYGTIEVGSSRSQSITLQNIGDQEISVTWSDLSSSNVFVSGQLQTQIEGRSSFTLAVSFIPTTEAEFSESFNVISATGEEYEISLLGLGFDNPNLEIEDALDNNTQITETSSVEFVVSSTDTSDIQQVTFAINGSSRDMSSTVGSDLFRTTWDLTDSTNGTYIIDITAIDNAGYSTSLRLIYTVGIYEPSLQERIFSNTNLYILAGVTIFMIVAAIFVTRRYMN